MRRYIVFFEFFLDVDRLSFLLPSSRHAAAVDIVSEIGQKPNDCEDGPPEESALQSRRVDEFSRGHVESCGLLRFGIASAFSHAANRLSRSGQDCVAQALVLAIDVAIDVWKGDFLIRATAFRFHASLNHRERTWQLNALFLASCIALIKSLVSFLLSDSG